jgi:Bacteriophage head to tail connecting protein
MAYAKRVPATQEYKELAQQHCQRWEGLYAEMSMWLTTWQELTEFIMPRKANVRLYRTPGQTQTERMLDATAVHANELLAASMQGSLTSGSVKWFYYRIRGLEYGYNTDTDVWLDQAGETSYDELKQSNFSAESHEFYADLGCVGTAAMFMAQKMAKPGQPWTGMRFKTLQPGSYAIAENDDGIVDTLYYKFKLTASQALKKWGFDRLSKNIQDALTTGRPQDMDKEFEFLHCVFPRTDAYAKSYQYRNSKGALPQKYPGAARDFASFFITYEDPTILEEGGFYEFPFAVARWTKTSGETYGRSPGFTALADIKTLNKLVELKLRALANMVYPPLKVRDDGVLGTVRLSPGALTHVRDMDAVDPLFIKGDINTAVLNEEKLQQAIRRMFFADQLQLQEGPQMTAYEVQVRYELMQRVLGPTLGRLETEYLGPIIEFVYHTLERNKRLKPIPGAMAALLDEKGKKFDIEYEGPLQRAQRLGDVVTIQRFMQVALPIIEMNPEAADNLDSDYLFRVLAKQTGAPPAILRSEEKRDEIRTAKRAQQQQVQQQTMANETMKAAGGMGDITKALAGAQASGILPQGGPTGQGVPTPGVGR